MGLPIEAQTQSPAEIMQTEAAKKFVDEFVAGAKTRPVVDVGIALSNYVLQLGETFGNIPDAALRRRAFNMFPRVVEQLDLGEFAVRRAIVEMDRHSTGNILASLDRLRDIRS